MNKAEFLVAMRTERAQWETVLAQVGEARMTRCGVAGDWSVKDVIAHITWFEREMVGVLRARALVGSDLWDLPSDQRNAAICKESRDRPLQEVLTEARQVYAQFVTEIASLSEEDLHEARRFAEMPADWVPWQILAGNSYEHYRDHSRSVLAWLETLSGSPA